MTDFISVYKDYRRQYGKIENIVSEGLYLRWDDHKIERAFNFGKGTIKDFMDFVHSNKDLHIFIDMTSGKVYNTAEKVDIESIRERVSRDNRR